MELHTGVDVSRYDECQLLVRVVGGRPLPTDYDTTGSVMPSAEGTVKGKIRLRNKTFFPFLQKEQRRKPNPEFAYSPCQEC